jgi:NADH dehydrogenase FAD-containing subunit
VIVSAPSPAAAVRRRELAKPFQFLNLGVLAYIGASKALAQISVDEKLVLGSGPLGFLLWRGIYWSKQVSWRNRALVGIDWIKARLFGRDINNL